MRGCIKAERTAGNKNEFRFKKFSVRQESSAMKVNTDGVLLSCWLSIDGFHDNCRILDIGTGTGVISLILAQRVSDYLPEIPFNIKAIDIDAPSLQEASHNFLNSPWSESLAAEKISLADYLKKAENEQFDLIVTNPPFFRSSLKPPSRRRSLARHDDEMDSGEIIRAAAMILKKERGRLAVILPPEEGRIFIELAKEQNLYLLRICRVKTLAAGMVKRWLMEFSTASGKGDLQNSVPVEEDLIIQESAGKDYTKDYKGLTAGFYLNF